MERLEDTEQRMVNQSPVVHFHLLQHTCCHEAAPSQFQSCPAEMTLCTAPMPVYYALRASISSMAWGTAETLQQSGSR